MGTSASPNGDLGDDRLYRVARRGIARAEHQWGCPGYQRGEYSQRTAAEQERSGFGRTVRRLAPILAAMVPLSSCSSSSSSSSTPLGYLEGSAGPASRIIQYLGWGFLIICIAVVVLIATLIIVATNRARRSAANSAADEIGSESNGVAAIYWGVGLSIPVLLGMAIWTFVSVRAIASPKSMPGLAITVTGHRWWWDIKYQAPSNPYGEVTTANELVIPVGVPVRLDLQTADVIHDFWVPKLGPKMDMIPGRINHSWIQADRAGEYRGQCAEFCGAQHGRMGFVVHAISRGDFIDWLRRQRQPATAAGPGKAVFETKCVACHMVRGTTAAGIYGPDLTHFGSRTSLGAAMLPNTPANLDHWLADTQGVKPGSRMPQIDLSPVERTQLVDWLEQLK